MNKTVVIYHRADFDGVFCREIARKFLPEAELFGWDYGDPVPTPDIVSAEDQLYMLDISIDGLMGHPKLIWIDHHKSAMEKFPPQIAGYRIDGVAACRLAWQWFTNMEQRRESGNELPFKEEYVQRTVVEPYAVQLAGEYDIWDKRNPDAELFQHGLRSRDLEPLWPMLLAERTKPEIKEIEAMMDVGHPFELNPDGTYDGSIGWVKGLLTRGEAIQYAKTQENESIIKAAGFTIQFEGLTFLAVNHARYNSHLFTAGLKPEHDACFGFCWRDGKWTVSLYHAPGKEHHDLSLIAVKHGGGGHRGACGFRTDKLPFLP
jgi:hypothetical protein